MKKAASILLSAVLGIGVLAGAGCTNPDGPDNVLPEPTIPQGYTRVDIAETANPFALEGIGAQIDQCVFTGGYTSSAIVNPDMTEEDFSLWKSRLEYMKIDLIRLAIVPDWYEHENDNDDTDVLDIDSPALTWDSPKMQAVYRVLDWCQELDIQVNFSLYGLYLDGFNAAKDPIYPPGWLTMPEDFEEFAETLYAGLYYMTEVKGYDVVREFSVYPEPDKRFVEAADRNFSQLIEACDAKLRREGVRDRFIFSGPAEVSDYAVFEQVVEDCGDIFDKFTGSFYKFNNSDSNFEILAGMEPFAQKAAEIGKTYGVSEFGSDLMISAAAQSDIDTFDRALYLARFVTLALNAGFTNMSYWVLGDSMYDNVLMELGLWKYKDEDWQPRPQFYTYSLITRYTQPGSAIYPMQFGQWSDLCGVALRSPENKWTYLVVNNGPTQQLVSLVNRAPDCSQEMNKYEVAETSLPADGQIEIQPSRSYVLQDGVLSVPIKARSFVLFTDLSYD